MTAAYLEDYKLNDALTKLLALPGYAQLSSLKEYTVARTNRNTRTEIGASAARLYRFFRSRMETFIRNVYSTRQYNYTLHTMGGDYSFRKMPLFYLSKDGKTVTVFKNVYFDPYYANYSDADVLTRFLVDLDKEMADPVKCKKWASVTAVKRKEVISVEKFIKTLPIFNGYKDHQIRDVAAALEDMDKPIVLHWGTTKKEWEEGYLMQGSESCMTVSDSKRAAWETVMAKDVFPIHMYTSMPGVKLAVFKKGSTVVGRCVCVENTGGKSVAIRLYVNNAANRPICEGLLKKAGLPWGSFEYYREWTAEALWSDKAADWYVPWTYLDVTKTVFLACFEESTDKKSGTFTFRGYVLNDTWNADKEIKKIKESGDTRGWAAAVKNSPRGWMTAGELNQIQCAMCAKHFKMNDIPPHRQTGAFVCSALCVSRAGWRIGYDHDGNRVTDNADEFITDPVTGDNYTNEHVAAKMSNGQVFREDLFTDGEDPQYTRAQGYLKVKHGKYLATGETDVISRLLNYLDGGKVPEDTPIAAVLGNIMDITRIEVSTLKRVECTAEATIVFNEDDLDKNKLKEFFGKGAGVKEPMPDYILKTDAELQAERAQVGRE